MITIKTLSVHSRSKSNYLEIEVFAKKGSHIEFEYDAPSWTQVADSRVQGLGYLRLTPIPEEDFVNVDVFGRNMGVLCNSQKPRFALHQKTPR